MVSDAVAAARRRKLQAAAKREGTAPPATKLALAGWTLLATNVPPERLRFCATSASRDDSTGSGKSSRVMSISLRPGLRMLFSARSRSSISVPLSSCYQSSLCAMSARVQAQGAMVGWV